ncbi:MAG: PA0069 family radical SAM protein [Phycisphaerales bacterium]|nr:PA0069 family radical SAM protein [Phycisphaerales bacterium]
MKPVANPPNPYTSRHAEWLEPPPAARVEVYEETARSILSENDSPDLPFRWSVNPYRGCQHACAYCYARPYHEFLELGAGTDFDTKLVVKINAPELLADAFARKSWRREAVNFSGVTDCYQPLEAVWLLTRRCLEVCVDHHNPAIVVTKGYLVVRDADLLAELNRRAGATVYISVPFASDKTARGIEPQAPPPSRRFAAIRRLCESGVPVGVLVAPVIPGLSDSEIPEILARAADAGATSASFVALRLPESVQPVFWERLKQTMPLRAERIEKRIRDIRGGQLNNTGFGRRMTGEGVYWDGVRRLFEVSAVKVGLERLRSPNPQATAAACGGANASRPGEPDLAELVSRESSRRSAESDQMTFGF